MTAVKIPNTIDHYCGMVDQLKYRQPAIGNQGKFPPAFLTPMPSRPEDIYNAGCSQLHANSSGYSSQVLLITADDRVRVLVPQRTMRTATRHRDPICKLHHVSDNGESHNATCSMKAGQQMRPSFTE